MTWVRALKRTVLAISEEYYRVTLETTAGIGAPVSCPTLVVGLSPIDTGQVDTSGTGHMSSPQAFTPPTPSSYPSVVLVGWAGQCGYSVIGSDPVIANYTEIQNGGPFGEEGSTFEITGYTALAAGSPPPFSVSWLNHTPSQLQAYRALSLIIPTAETTPVQYGQQSGPGGLTTLGAAPTAGNLLVLYKYGPRGFSPPDPPPGFTTIAFVTISGLTITTYDLELCVRCADGSEGTSIFTGDSSFGHWASLSEWALT